MADEQTLSNQFSQSLSLPQANHFPEQVADQIHDPYPSVTPNAPYEIINQKFAKTMEIADDMLVRLVGESGDGGYLGALNELITKYQLPASILEELETSTAPVVASNRTLPTPPQLDTDFGSFDGVRPTFVSLPNIDSSPLQNLTPPVRPADPSINWTEIALSGDIYSYLVTRVTNDLASGATGLDPEVEAEIYARAIARQDTENDRKYIEVETYFAARGFDLPQGAMAGRLGEIAAEILHANEDINGKVMIEQAELAQKNSQIIITQGLEFEKLLRATRDGESNRSLDKAKSTADLALMVYAEDVRAYIGMAEAARAYVSAQVEVLQGAIAQNKGLGDLYQIDAGVFKTTVDAKAVVNSNLTEAYKAEMIGFDAGIKADTANQSAVIESNKLILQKADLNLRKIIAEIDASIKGFTAESSFKEKVSGDMAQLAANAIGSALNSVNASASMGYSGSESRSESYSKSESKSESNSFGAHISESHNYEHDPLI